VRAQSKRGGLFYFRATGRRQLLDQFNKDNLDDASPVGGDRGMKVLDDMNDLASPEDEVYRKVGAGLKVI